METHRQNMCKSDKHSREKKRDYHQTVMLSDWRIENNSDCYNSACVILAYTLYTIGNGAHRIETQNIIHNNDYSG